MLRQRVGEEAAELAHGQVHGFGDGVLDAVFQQQAAEGTVSGLSPHRRNAPSVAKVERQHGGWFAVVGNGWSGPWISEQAAKLAGRGYYEKAHALERRQQNG